MKQRILQLAAMLLAALCLFALPACGSAGGDTIIRYDFTTQPRSLDPQLAYTGESLLVLENVFEGLLRQSPEGVRPGAAERWEVSDDGLTYTFYLRQGGRWSDGKTPLTAHDFVFAFQRVVDPATASPSAAGFLCIQNARQVLSGALPPTALDVLAPNDLTFVVRLTAPNPFFLELCATAAAMPCNEVFFLEARGRYGNSGEYLLTNGPFYIRRTLENKRMELRANEYYQSESPVLPAGVNLYFQADDQPDKEQPDKVLQSAAEKAASRFLEGSTDAVAATPAQAERYLAALPGAQTTSFENRVWGLAFNCSDAAYSNTALRRAFSLALDSSALAPHLTGSLAPAYAIVPSAISLLGLPYREAVGSIQPPVPNVNSAQALYREALAALELEKVPRTSILCPDTGNFAVMLGSYQRQLQQAFGIYINLEPMPEEELLARVLSGDYTLALVPITAERGSPDAVLDRFASYSARNIAGYSSPGYDALLAGAQESGAQEAAALYRQAEQLLVDDAVFLPVAFETTYYVSAPGLQGLEFSPFSYRIFFQHATRAAK